MRSTQFVGLTKRAQEFVEKLTPLPSDRKTQGLSSEDIELRRWAWPQSLYPIRVEERLKTACIREVVQAVPWSSGPMFFTCLELDWGFPDRNPNTNFTKVLQWVEYPSLAFVDEHGVRGGSEYDVDQGIFWV